MKRLEKVWDDFLDNLNGTAYYVAGNPNSRKNYRIYRIYRHCDVVQVSNLIFQKKIAFAFKMNGYTYSHDEVNRLFRKWRNELPRITFNVEKIWN